MIWIAVVITAHFIRIVNVVHTANGGQLVPFLVQHIHGVWYL